MNTELELLYERLERLAIVLDEIIKEETANRPQELVRCKNCIWFHKSDFEKNLCECIYHGFVTNEDKYCWWGEKDA